MILKRASVLTVSTLRIVNALGFFAAKHIQNRKRDTVRVVCSFSGSADNPRANLPAVFGHGLLRYMQSLMSSALF